MRSTSVLFLTSLLALSGCGGYTTAPQVATRITIYTGNGQSGLKGSVLPDPLCTNVWDANNQLIRGATVTYTVATGGGQLQAPASVQTDGSGIAASGTWTLGPVAGAQTVTASVAGATGTLTVTFMATAQ